MAEVKPEFVGKTVQHLTEVDSTNTFLQHWSNTENLAEGTAVTADFQNQGRGQRGTTWLSRPAENILTSVLFYPDFIAPDEQFYLNIAVALAIHDFISEILPGHMVKIKWPNDIWVDEQKIAGILIENSIQGNRLKCSVVGIGININLPAGSVEGATSYAELTGEQRQPKYFLPTLYMALEKRYTSLKQGFKQHLYNEYLSKLYGLGRQLQFKKIADDTIFTGTITGINKYGNLCVQTPKDAEVFGIKEITFLAE